jgi:pathogenesis-related protein 1
MLRPTLALVLLALSSCDGGTAAPDAPGSHGNDGRIGDGAPGGDAPLVDAPMADVPGGVGEPVELTGMTLYHNQVRAMVGVPPLQWDPALAKIAHDWVIQCIDVQAPIGLVDHDANRSATYPVYVGENIYGSGGGASAMDAVNLWASEKANYDHATNSCASGQICGHYTQLVWRDTQKVGCALYTCPGLQYGATIVCDYGPGGNIGGQSPY